MPKQYDDTNTFVLYVNDKGENQKRPDRTGKINIDGTWYKLAGWVRDGAKGKFLSGTVQPLEEKAEKPKAAPVYKGGADDSDSIPF